MNAATSKSTGAKLRAAVIGAGHMGSYHAQKLAALDHVELVAIADADVVRAKTLAERYGARALEDFAELLGVIDIAVIAAPTELHYAIAAPCLKAGVHVLLEKPIARTVDEAGALVQLAALTDRVLQVGHLERFNPAVVAARGQVSTARYIEAHRLTPFRARGLDVDVVLDLMIHDIDLALSFVPSEVVDVRAMGSPVLTQAVDIANARIEFANGCVASLTASRVSAKAMRKLRVFAPERYVSVDTLTHQLTVARKTAGAQDGQSPFDIDERDFGKSDPLLEQARAFVAAVRDGTPPAVSAHDGERALSVALAVRKEVERAMAQLKA